MIQIYFLIFFFYLLFWFVMTRNRSSCLFNGIYMHILLFIAKRPCTSASTSFNCAITVATVVNCFDWFYHVSISTSIGIRSDSIQSKHFMQHLKTDVLTYENPKKGYFYGENLSYCLVRDASDINFHKVSSIKFMSIPTILTWNVLTSFDPSVTAEYI